MRTLQEWAEHYKKTRIWVYPYYDYSEHFQWLHWRNMNESDYDKEFNTYNWNSAEGINVVTGKMGILSLKITKDKNIIYAIKTLLKVLSEIGLQQEYDWVIEGRNYYSVVLDIHNMPMGSIKKQYRDLYIYYEDSYILPPIDNISNSESHFINGIPLGHPKQLSWNSFSSRMAEIEKIDIVDSPNSKKNSQRKRIYIGASVLFGIIAILAFFFIMAVVTSAEQLSFFETLGVLTLIVIIFLGGAFFTGAFK